MTDAYRVPHGLARSVKSSLEWRNPGTEWDVTVIIQLKSHPKAMVFSTVPPEKMPPVFESICDDIVRGDFKHHQG
jgi:hypothetical protein